MYIKLCTRRGCRLSLLFYCIGICTKIRSRDEMYIKLRTRRGCRLSLLFYCIGICTKIRSRDEMYIKLRTRRGCRLSLLFYEFQCFFKCSGTACCTFFHNRHSSDSICKNYTIFERHFFGKSSYKA